MTKDMRQRATTTAKRPLTLGDFIGVTAMIVFTALFLAYIIVSGMPGALRG